GRREALGHVDHQRPVRPAAVVVLVGHGHVGVVEPDADLLAELAEGPGERVLAAIERPTGDRPGAALVAQLRPPGEEEPGLAAAVEVPDEETGGAVPPPSATPVGQRHEAVAR